MNAETQTHPSSTEMSNRLREVQGKVGETAQRVSQATDRYVHDNPWRTILIAAVVGCVVGFLMRRED